MSPLLSFPAGGGRRRWDEWPMTGGFPPAARLATIEDMNTTPTRGETHPAARGRATGRQHSGEEEGCPDPPLCLRDRRIADLHCSYCGDLLGYGRSLTWTASDRYSHTSCVDELRAALAATDT